MMVFFVTSLGQGRGIITIGYLKVNSESIDTCLLMTIVDDNRRISRNVHLLRALMIQKN